MSNRELIDDSARWIPQGSEPRTAGVKALFSMRATTTSSRAQEHCETRLERQKRHDRVWQSSRKTSGVATLIDVFQWTSSDSLEDKWLKWVRD